MKFLVTGAAGFIGSHVVMYLLGRGDDVIAIDNINDYYDPQLKHDRLQRIEDYANGKLKDEVNTAPNPPNMPGYYEFQKIDLSHRDDVESLFVNNKFDRVIHLAAQAGVRHSITHPFDYIDANIAGFLTVLEGCRQSKTPHLVYASTSSAYGLNNQMPYSVEHPANHPVALYGATKRANELMAHSYSHLYQLSTTGLRFFTVYGPWGRPDMALFKFTKSILENKPIEVFNNGLHLRDFTYIDDIVTGIILAADKINKGHPQWSPSEPRADRSSAPWRLYNIGSQSPIDLISYIDLIEQELDRTATKVMLPIQPGDIPDTFANIDSFIDDFDYAPSTSIDTGIHKFVTWYRQYYNV